MSYLNMIFIFLEKKFKNIIIFQYILANKNFMHVKMYFEVFAIIRCFIL